VTPDMWQNYLRKCLEEMLLPSSKDAADNFFKFHKFLKIWNSKFNLTAITDWEDSVNRHYLDSASVSLGYPFANRIDRGDIQVLDVGSGAGFPGIPLKILFPEIQLTLLDSVRKKTEFMKRASSHLKLEGTYVKRGRAEILARDDRHREVYDLVVARAVSELNALVELTIPFCKIGGYVIAMKGRKAHSEVSTAIEAIEQLGGELDDIIDCNESHGFLKGHLVVISKIASTPERFPRRPGVPTKRPLSSN